jgi:hypothetical protein
MRRSGGFKWLRRREENKSAIISVGHSDVGAARAAENFFVFARFHHERFSGEI